jgi:hypothetical protein
MYRYKKSYVGLHKFDTYIKDTDPNSAYFAINQFPDILTGGKNSFLIAGTSKLLENSEIMVEVLDEQGNVIYSEYPKYIGVEDDIFKSISIYVYAETPIGQATITIVGQSKDVPDEWKGHFNVMWQRTVMVDPTSLNVSPIKFYKVPDAVVYEEVKPYLGYEFTTSSINETYFESGSTINGTYFNPYSWNRYKITLDKTTSFDISVSGSDFSNKTMVSLPAGEGQLSISGDNWTIRRYDSSNAFGILSTVSQIGMISPSTNTNWVLLESKNPILLPNDGFTINTYEITIDYSVLDFVNDSNSALFYYIIDGESTATIPESMYVLNGNHPDVIKSGYLNVNSSTTKISFSTALNKIKVMFGLFVLDPIQDSVSERVTFNKLTLSTFKPFTQKMVGGYISASVLDPHNERCNYSAKITEVWDNRTLITDHSFIRTRSFWGVSPKILNFYSGSFSITYSAGVKEVASEVTKLQSFAHLYLRNIDTYSGDIHKVKIYTKTKNHPDFEFVGDFELESKELLKVSDIDTGFFIDKPTFDNYWTINSSSNALPLVYDIEDDVLLNSLKLVGGAKGIYTISHDDVISTDEDTLFTLTGKFIQKYPIGQNAPYLDVYISGSAFKETPYNAINYYQTESNLSNLFESTFTNNSFGKLIKRFVPTNSSLNSFNLDFKSDFSGSGKLIFVTSGEECYISDISLEYAKETNFSPTNTNFIIPVDTRKRGELVNFKVEFYNNSNLKSDAEIFIENVPFYGSNLVIEGSDNLITGSVYMGKTLFSGIEMSGQNSAFIRSVGYEGFISASNYGYGGFMFYTGSVLPDKPDNYRGVGLELHAGYNSGSMRFRADDSGSYLEISGTLHAQAGDIGGWELTERYILSNNHKMMLSGSGVISSSHFYLSENGDITASNAHFLGSVYVNGTISGSELHVDTGSLSGWQLLPGLIRDSNDKFRIQVSGSNFVLSASNFQVDIEGGLTASNANVQGTISAQQGNIGSWIITNKGLIKGQNITLDAENSRLYKTDDENMYFIDFTPTGSYQISGSNSYYVRFGPNFAVRSDGTLVASGATIEGVLTASEGYIAQWHIASSSLNRFTDGGQYIGMNSAGSEVTFFAGAKTLSESDMLAATFNVTKDGKITAKTGSIANWIIENNYIKSNNLQMYSGQFPYIGFGVSEYEAVNGIYVGQKPNENLWVASFMSNKNYLKWTGTELLISGSINATIGHIGGWGISEKYISGSNLVLHSNGSIYTADYVSGLKGWTLTSDMNGYAEFENARIRGTLSTVVFEKETINAVGGQLWVANSTTIESASNASDTEFYVKNATGFAVGEILIIKRVDNTGFSAEYVRVNSVDSSSSKIGVDRAYGSDVTGSNWKYVGFNTSVTSSYEVGQVLASTGLSGSGFIKLNANPHDLYTPYIDIVERTGSGLYDLKLKARLGDLSGLSSEYTYGEFGTRFGLYTIDAYIEGAIHAQTGSFQGVVHAGSFKFGKKVSGNNNGIYLTDNNYWYDTGTFRVGGDYSYILASTSSIKVNTDNFQLTGSNLMISSSGEISSSNFHIKTDGTVFVKGTIQISDGTSVESYVGSATASLSSSVGSAINNVSSSLNTSINTVSSSAGSSISNLSSSLSQLSSSFIELSSSGGPGGANPDEIVTDAMGKIVKAQTMNATYGSGLYLTSTYMGYYKSGSATFDDWRAYISSSGEFLFKKDADNLISFGNNQFILKSTNAVLSGSNVNIISQNFGLYGSNLLISSSGEISSSNFRIKTDGTVFVKGTIQISDGTSVENYVGSATASLSSSVSTSITSVSSSVNGTINSVSSSLNSTITTVSSSTNSTINSVSSSLNTSINNVSGSVSTLSGSYTIFSGSVKTDMTSLASKIVTDASGSIVKGQTMSTANQSGLYLTSNYLGYYKSGSASFDDWRAYISSSGEFLFKKDNDNLISFGNDQFTIKSTNAILSGSNVNIISQNFGLYGTNLMISSSGQISSSYFSLNSTGLTLSGSVYANYLQANLSGSIAGWIFNSGSLYKDDSTNGIGLIPDSSEQLKIYVGSTYVSRSLAPFKVNKIGKLYSQGAVIDSEPLVPVYSLDGIATSSVRYYTETFASSSGASIFNNSTYGSQYVRQMDTDFGKWTVTVSSSVVSNAPLGFISHYSEYDATNVPSSNGYYRTSDGAISLYTAWRNKSEFYDSGSQSRIFKKAVESSYLQFPNITYPKVKTVLNDTVVYDFENQTIEVGFIVRFLEFNTTRGVPGNSNPTLRVAAEKYNGTTLDVNSTYIGPEYSVDSNGSNWFTAKISLPTQWFSDATTGNQNVKFRIEVNPFPSDSYAYNASGTTIDFGAQPAIAVREFFIRRPIVLKDVVMDSLNIRGGLTIDGNLTVNGSQTVIYDQQANGDILPAFDNTYRLGSSSRRFADIYAVQTTTGGIFESGLRTPQIGTNETGTVVVWRNGKLVPCDSMEDNLVMGVIKKGKDEPIIAGAEYILVTGKVKCGDLIVTSDKIGHGKSAKRYLLLNKYFKRNLTGKIIGQALEDANGNSTLIKAFITKM